MRTENWKFAQGPNMVALTTKGILSGADEIRFAFNQGDGAPWLFLEGEDPSDVPEVDTTLGELVNVDSTVQEIADIPPGFYAARSGKGSKWSIFRKLADF